MFRRIIAVVAFGVISGSCMADEIRAIITKVDGTKVTFAESKGKGEKGDEKTLSVTDSTKYVTAKFDKETKKVEVGDALEGGLKNEKFTKIGEKGLRATIITDADNKNITEIRVFQGKGK